MSHEPEPFVPFMEDLSSDVVGCHPKSFLGFLHPHPSDDTMEENRSNLSNIVMSTASCGTSSNKQKFFFPSIKGNPEDQRRTLKEVERSLSKESHDSATVDRLKKRRRQLKNLLYARESRARKRNELSALQQTIEEQERTIKSLRQEIHTLKQSEKRK